MIEVSQDAVWRHWSKCLHFERNLVAREPFAKSLVSPNWVCIKCRQWMDPVIDDWSDYDPEYLERFE